MYTGKLGVAIFSFDRPHYLRRLLASLEENTHLENTDFHLFQDGAINQFSGRRVGRTGKIRLAVETAKQVQLPNKHFHIRRENVGVGINQFEAYEAMTERYQVVLMLEDDIVVSPHYLRVMRVLFDSIRDMEDIFSASSGFRKRNCPGSLRDCLDKMVRTQGYWWGDIFASHQWPKIRPHFLRYYKLIENVDYRARPGHKILELYRQYGSHHTATSQDAAREVAVTAAGMNRIRLVVNRAIYIGQRGTHWSPALYYEQGWHEQEPYVFPEDESIERFELL